MAGRGGEDSGRLPPRQGNLSPNLWSQNQTGSPGAEEAVGCERLWGNRLALCGEVLGLGGWRLGWRGRAWEGNAGLSGGRGGGAPALVTGSPLGPGEAGECELLLLGQGGWELQIRKLIAGAGLFTSAEEGGALLLVTNLSGAVGPA